MPARVVYSSIYDGGAGQKRIGKRMASRLRLKGFFGKREHIDYDKKKSLNDETHTIADTTIDESPIKEEKEDSFDGHFDRYYASSFLPHITVVENDVIGRVVEKQSAHWQAFANADEMKIPPSPPQKARARKQTLRDQYPLSKAGNGSAIKPTNLATTFQNEAETIATTAQPHAQTDAIDDEQQLTRVVAVPPPAAAAAAATNVPRDKRVEALNTAKELVSFGDDLIDTVERSQSEIPLMFDKLMNSFSEEGVISSFPKLEEEEEDSTHNKTGQNDTTAIPKETNATGTTNYQQLLKSKMDSVAATMSTIAAEAQTSTFPACRHDFCSMLECADGFSKAVLENSTDLSSSPLDHSWFSMNEDSDSVSKLTLPLDASDLNMSILSDIAATIEKPASPRTILPRMCYDF